MLPGVYMRVESGVGTATMLLLWFMEGSLSVAGALSSDGFANDYTCDNFPDYTAYENQWTEDFPQEARKLYPFGETFCDTLADSTQHKFYGFDPNIQFNVPFYGKLYRSLWISPSGFIALDQESSASPIPFIWVDQWPNPQYPLPNALDPPLIAPFYSEADMVRTPDPSQMNYRILDPRSAGTQLKRIVMEGMLNKLSLDVRGAVLGTDKFQATYGIVVTWSLVTFGASDCTGNNNDCRRNTYQAAVITDETETFAIFSYYDMKWVGGAGVQNCDRMTGTTSSSRPNCKPGHIGFNAGEGRGFHPLPQSGQNSITEIDTGGGSNVTGRFYYKISGDSIVRGGCVNDQSLAGPRWPAEIFPRSGGMLGGSAVQISGPCFNNADRIKCRYGDVQTEAVLIDNVMRVTCVAPMMNKVGAIKVGVSIDGGNNFKFETDYIVITQDHVDPKVRVLRQNQDWMNPQQFELKWSPEDLKGYNNVNIKLVGYKEVSTSGTPEGIWEELHTLSEGYSNTGNFLFQADTYQCNYNDDTQRCTQFDFGAFQVSIEYPTDDPSNPRREWSRIFPLAWYIKNAMQQAEGSNWIQRKCDIWYYANGQETAWINELDPCPCTLEQAYTDFGRFQPYPLCQRGSMADNNCERHEGARHCVLSVRPGQSGPGNQCCYNAQDQLMYSGDSQYGSLPQRSHVWGSVPYRTPPRIPKLSHWVADIMGFYYCCEWQSVEKDCQSKYLPVRHTKNCQNYQVPGKAVAYGDPHFVTFDGVFYTFNGFGEYWLMKVMNADVAGQTINFKLQTRQQQPPKQPWGYTNATIMTAVGMQLGDSYRIVLELNQGGVRKSLLLHIDDYLLDLTRQDYRRQEFQDMIIINNDDLDNEQATNFTVVYRCGIAVNVFTKNSLLDLVVSAPPEFKDLTRGLLGKWNDDPADDLEPQNPGGPPFNPDETEKVHNLFGETWRVTNTESCFVHLYRSQLNYNYYNRPNFVPNYIPKFPSNNTGITDDTVNSQCQSEKGCTFDFKATLDSAVGRDSKTMREWDQQRREMGDAVYSCPWLPIPYSTKSEPISYLVGSQVTITGCIEGYTLEGPTAYSCQSNGQGPGYWSPDVTTKCRGPDDPLPTTTALAIAIPVALGGVLLIIAIVVVILVCRKKRKKKRQAKESKQVYVPVFQEIIDWRKGTQQPSEKQDHNTLPKRRDRSHSREGMADFMGGNADTFTIVPAASGKKPPRPDPNKDKEENVYAESVDDYDNKVMNDTPSSGNHVSWDTQDGDSTKPLKMSTLKSNKGKKNVLPPPDPEPEPSPKPAKRTRPYQYPTESRDNSLDSWSNENPTLQIRGGNDPTASYKPRDKHSYAHGHDIPTNETGVSNYYKRKYGRYGNNTSYS